MPVKEHLNPSSRKAATNKMIRCGCPYFKSGLAVSIMIAIACHKEAELTKPATPKPLHNSIVALEKDPNYVWVQEGANVKIDLKYATEDNFMRTNLYSDFNRCYLHKIAYTKFKKAKQLLARQYPGLHFVLFDCLRPRRVQRVMWAQVRGTKQQAYVANPDRGSVHNFGFALDLSLLDADQRPLEMGTAYDDFTPLAEPRREQEFLKKGKIRQQQIDNRLVLRRMMTQAGFQVLANEWWHFDAVNKSIVRKKYKIFE